jgi:hypothetical protein
MSNTRPTLSERDREVLAFVLACMRDDRERASNPDFNSQYEDAEELFSRILGKQYRAR